ncbi:MAG: hypothetical protein WCL61_01060 [bacterium]
MKNKGIIIALVIVLVAGVAGIIVAKNMVQSPANPLVNNQQSASQATQVEQILAENKILFYGSQCPHCKNIEAFIAQNGIESKLKFVQLEVQDNADNVPLLLATAKKCVIADKDLGVPLFWSNDEKKCYSGEDEVLNYFKVKVLNQVVK